MGWAATIAEGWDFSSDLNSTNDYPQSRRIERLLAGGAEKRLPIEQYWIDLLPARRPRQAAAAHLVNQALRQNTMICWGE